MYGKNETVQIMDYLSNRIENLTNENRDVFKITGEHDTEVSARIRELEDVRAFIAVNFY